MSEASDLRTMAATIIEANSYMTLATADADGLPWASPVWFASTDGREFFWVSSPEARHSVNIATRPQIAIVIFDSHQLIGTGRGVYVSAFAERVSDADIDPCMAVFSDASQAEGADAWSRADVEGRLRLYRATAAEHFVLSGKDTRLPIDW